MAVARQLSAFPADQLPAPYAAELKSLWREYENSLLLNADMPEEQMSLGSFYSATGDVMAAEKAYRHALRLSPAYVPAMLNLADLYRENDLDQQGEVLLLQAVQLAPDQASVQHAMGLLKIRQGSLNEAIPYLQAAAEMDRQDLRFVYVYSVALWETGNRKQAITELERTLANSPGNRELVSALASYYQQLGEEEKLRQLLERYSPQN
jgi:Flp pilus assembly protein TadD